MRWFFYLKGNNNPQIINDEIVYSNAFDDKTDISYALDHSGVKETIIVDEPNGCTCYYFEISAEGLVPDTESGKTINLLKRKSFITISLKK